MPQHHHSHCRPTEQTGRVIMNVRATSDTAIEQLYHDYQGPILRYIERLVSNDETAEDLCQETIIKALRAWAQHDPSATACRWLYRIATNAAYDYFRRQRRIGFATLAADQARRQAAPGPEAYWDDV